MSVEATSVESLRGKQLKVWNKTSGRCWYCGIQTNLVNGDLFRFTIDHIIPRLHEGSSALDNLVPACHSCNAIKGNKTLDQFRQIVARQTQGVPTFNKWQHEYLRSIGVRLPKLHYVFYFEREAERRGRDELES